MKLQMHLLPSLSRGSEDTFRMEEQEIGEEIESNRAKGIRAFQGKRGIFFYYYPHTQCHTCETQKTLAARGDSV